MNITVILCTYNRCQSLAKALDSVANSMLPSSVECEVLIVDNNSRDRTRQIAEEFCLKYPDRFRYVFEIQQGKSFALNTAIREARGNVLAFMDDDVTVEPTWLQNLTLALDGGEWSGAGDAYFRLVTLQSPDGCHFRGRTIWEACLRFSISGKRPYNWIAPLRHQYGIPQGAVSKIWWFSNRLRPVPR